MLRGTKNIDNMKTMGHTKTNSLFFRTHRKRNYNFYGAGH